MGETTSTPEPLTHAEMAVARGHIAVGIAQRLYDESLEEYQRALHRRRDLEAQLREVMKAHDEASAEMDRRAFAYDALCKAYGHPDEVTKNET